MKHMLERQETKMLIVKVSLLEEWAPNPSKYLVLAWLFKLY